mmetsp:Transcript_32185/g.91701  ORF Transcript_32185/g.91701 Transcript_32185/m.91701 type:complete len:223 (-) Transcript_32185:1054-1722(-)
MVSGTYMRTCHREPTALAKFTPLNTFSAKSPLGGSRFLRFSIAGVQVTRTSSSGFAPNARVAAPPWSGTSNTTSVGCISNNGMCAVPTEGCRSPSSAPPSKTSKRAVGQLKSLAQAMPFGKLRTNVSRSTWSLKVLICWNRSAEAFVAFLSLSIGNKKMIPLNIPTPANTAAPVMEDATLKLFPTKRSVTNFIAVGTSTKWLPPLCSSSYSTAPVTNAKTAM